MENTEYDDQGRVISSTDVLGRVTRTEYSGDGLTTTVTTPAGATLITQKYYDGIDLFHGGTGQREMETRLELTEEGILTTTLSRGVVLSRRLENGLAKSSGRNSPIPGAASSSPGPSTTARGNPSALKRRTLLLPSRATMSWGKP